MLKNFAWVFAAMYLITFNLPNLTKEALNWSYIGLMTCEVYVGFSVYAVAKMDDGIKKVKIHSSQLNLF